MEIFFNDQANLEWIIENFWRNNFSRYVLTDRNLKISASIFQIGHSGLQFDVGRAPLATIPFCVPFNAVIWVKNGEGNVLWQNQNYNEDGSLALKEG
jgi:hypothetical protein